AELEAKRLEFLHELVPKAAKIGFLVNLSNPSGEFQVREVKAAADTVGKQLDVLGASTEDEIVAAFAFIGQRGVGALQVALDPFLLNRRDQLIALAARHAVPAVYGVLDFVVAGGLASYGNSAVEAYRQAGIYVGQILKGTKPADLPVVRPTKF